MLPFLTDATIVAAIKQAWHDSQADDPVERHEEGGYIVRSANLTYAVERWPFGTQFRIIPPALDADSRYNGRVS